MRMMIGDLEYERLRHANPVLAPVFFLSYAIGSVLVLVNVFIAILNEYYVEVKERHRSETADFDRLSFAGQQKALGRVSRAVTFSSLVGNGLWALLVRVRTAGLRVHAQQESLELVERETVLVCVPSLLRKSCEQEHAEALGEEDEGEEGGAQLTKGGRLGSYGSAVGEEVPRLLVTHDLTYWAKEADTLTFAGGLVLRVDAVKPHGCLCQVVSQTSAIVPVRAGMRIHHREYRSEQDELVLIGLLAMVRWRLTELDRTGAQVVNTQQLLDMAVSAMLGRSRRSLYTPLHYLAQHASERAEKLEACRQMSQRAARGETSELDRLKVRALLLPSITSLMDKYGFDDRNGEYHSRADPRLPGGPEPAADAHFSRSEPGDDGGFVGGTPEGAGSKAAGPARAQPASPGAAPAAQLAAIERKLDLLLGGLAATRSEGRELRASLERLERRMAAALPPDEPWAEAEDGRAPGWQAQAQGGSQSLY